MGYKVILTYFKSTGKYYSTGIYHTNKDNMLDIFDEVILMRDENNLPGIIYSDFIILVSVESDFSFPKLLFPKVTGEF